MSPRSPSGSEPRICAAKVPPARVSASITINATYRGGEALARQVVAHVERKSGRLADAITEMSRTVEIAESLRQRLADRDLRATYIG